VRRRTRSGSDLFRASLWSTEYLSLGMIGLYTLLDLVFIQHVKSSFGILQMNLSVALAIIASAMWYQQTRARVALIFRSFYILPIAYMLYSQVSNYIVLVNPHNYDHTLASWDRTIFGVNPTQWIYRFAHPVLTAYFQIWYNSFQLMLVPPAIEFFSRRRMRTFRVYAMTLLFGFYLSYLLYFIMPAIGPRFEVHDFYSIDRELPGLFFTQPFRDLINAGNNITPDMTNPYDVVNRDCMPSGHTMMSVLGILMAWRYRSRWRWLLTVGGTSVVISTVYLRYHYVVDVIAGLILALIVFASHEAIVSWWKRRGIKV
jgi:membrane-associated phospholipid phosphatase